MIRAYQIIDGNGTGKVPEKKRKNGMEIIGRKKIDEVKETNEKDTIHFRVWCLFLELRRGSSTLLGKAACGVPVFFGVQGFEEYPYDPDIPSSA